MKVTLFRAYLASLQFFAVVVAVSSQPSCFSSDPIFPGHSQTRQHFLVRGIRSMSAVLSLSFFFVT